MMPVTAGKNTAKTSAKEPPLRFHHSIAFGAASPWPVKNETSETAIIAITTYWALIARSALRNEISASRKQTAVLTAVAGTAGHSLASDSVKPTM